TSCAGRPGADASVLAGPPAVPPGSAAAVLAGAVARAGASGAADTTAAPAAAGDGAGAAALRSAPGRWLSSLRQSDSFGGASSVKSAKTYPPRAQRSVRQRVSSVRQPSITWKP